MKNIFSKNKMFFWYKFNKFFFFFFFLFHLRGSQTSKWFLYQNLYKNGSFETRFRYFEFVGNLLCCIASFLSNVFHFISLNFNNFTRWEYCPRRNFCNSFGLSTFHHMLINLGNFKGISNLTFYLIYEGRLFLFHFPMSRDSSQVYLDQRLNSQWMSLKHW